MEFLSWLCHGLRDHNTRPKTEFLFWNLFHFLVRDCNIRPQKPRSYIGGLGLRLGHLKGPY